jgi:hypothetical protein
LVAKARASVTVAKDSAPSTPLPSSMTSAMVKAPCWNVIRA